jgi:hypothetical protein
MFSGRQDAAGSADVFFATTRSTLILEIKEEIIMVAMIRNLYKMFIIFDPLNSGR